MGIQTMSSQGGGASAGQRSQIQSLARQGSLYSLTLNEVQTHLGEPLSSMNLDELLKSVWPADGEESQPIDLEGIPTQYAQYASGSDLQRQGSITMPRALSKKTVDEIWKDIEHGLKKCDTKQTTAQDSQMTLGEMTLEDFLVKAGVVAEGPVKDGTIPSGSVGPVGAHDPVAGVQESRQGMHWLHPYHQMPSMDQQHQVQQSMIGSYIGGYPVPPQISVGTGPILDAMYPEGQMNLSSPTMGTSSDPQTPRRKRGASGDMVEKIVERRQKRMIKNRESAARSRARKQAYTHELENKVSRLEEENDKLKKQKKLDEILYVPMPEPRYQLRRTSSAPF